MKVKQVEEYGLCMAKDCGDTGIYFTYMLAPIRLCIKHATLRKPKWNKK
jgi:hypothetical protein